MTEWTITTLKEFMDERFRGQEEALLREREERRERDMKTNEFRGQLEDQAGTFATRNEVETKVMALEQLIRSETKAQEEKIKGKNVLVTISTSGAIVALLIAVFNFASFHN